MIAALIAALRSSDRRRRTDALVSLGAALERYGRSWWHACVSLGVDPGELASVAGELGGPAGTLLHSARLPPDDPVWFCDGCLAESVRVPVRVRARMLRLCGSCRQRVHDLDCAPNSGAPVVRGPQPSARFSAVGIHVSGPTMLGAQHLNGRLRWAWETTRPKAHDLSGRTSMAEMNAESTEVHDAPKK